MRAGDTFRRSVGEHLRIVASDPEKDSDNVVVVSVTTARRNPDTSCLLDVGDHPYIRHASFISYRHARILSNADLDRQLAAGQISLEQPVSDELLSRIREGAGNSSFIPYDCQKVLEDQGFVET